MRRIRKVLKECATSIAWLLPLKKELSYQYYYENIGNYFNVILTPSKHKGFIDVFCVDNTELAETQQMLRSANHKLSMSLDVANIVPWKWDLEKGYHAL